MKAFFVKLKTKLVTNKALCVALSLFFIATAGLFVSSCGKKECKHNYEVVLVVNPTCTEQGYTTYRCSKCKETKNDDYVPANGHTFRNGECVYCHAKQTNEDSQSGNDNTVTEEDFYANMLISVADMNGFVIEAKELEGKLYVRSEVYDNEENLIVSYEKTDNAVEIDVEKAVLSIDENGKLIGAISGKATLLSSSNTLLIDNRYDFTAVIKNETLYSKLLSEDRYAHLDSANGGDWQSEVTISREKIPLERLLLETENGETDSFATIYGVLSSIGANIEEIRAEIGGFADSVFGLQKFVIENAFTKKSVKNGYEFRFDPACIKKAINYLFDNTVNEVIDDVFGAKTSEKFSAFVLSSLNKTLDVILSDLKILGFDYEALLDTLDNVYFKVTGEENYFTNALQAVLDEFDGLKLKQIIAEASKMSEAEVADIVTEIVESFKTKNAVEFFVWLVINPPKGETIDEFVAKIRFDLEDTADYAAEILGAEAFGFNTDLKGNIVSFTVNLAEFPVSERTDSSNNYYEYVTNVIGAKVEVKPGELGDMSKYEALVAEIDGYTIVKPNTKVESKFYESATLEFVADENGVITGLNVKEADSDAENVQFEFVENYYTLNDYGYCGDWLCSLLHYKVTYNDGVSEIRSAYFYYNTVTKELTAVQPDYHSFEIVEEESDNVCGGKLTRKCTVCDYKFSITLSHVGTFEQSYELAIEGGYCTDGVIVTTTCSECGEVLDKSFVYGSKHFYEDSDVEELEIPEQGEDCKFKAFVSKCVCGKQIRVETKGHQSVSLIPCDDGLTEGQEQIDGYFNPGNYGDRYETLNNSFRYTCFDCDLVLYYDVLWLKAEDKKCTAELVAVIRYEKGEQSGIIKKYVYETHTYHDYDLSETDDEETGLHTSKYVCKDCGSSYEYTEKQYTDKEGTAHRDEIYIVVNNLNDGKAKRVERKMIYVSGETVYSQEYSEITITADGETIRNYEKETTTPYDGTIPEGLDVAAKIVHDKNGVKSEQIIAAKDGLEKIYLLYEYTEKEDGTWVKKEYTYDFAAGCKYTLRITYSDGRTYEENGTDHASEVRTIKESTCASDGLEVDECLMCRNALGKERVVKAEGHEFVGVADSEEMICYKCGALESPGDVTPEGVVVEDITDYEDGENYVAAYNGLQNDGFTLSLVLREKYGINEERNEVELAFGDDKFVVDALNRAISFDKAAADALKNAKIKELGLNADDYYLSLCFTVVNGTETVKAYREFKLPPLTEGEVVGECFYVVTAGDGKWAEITITVSENIRLKITSITVKDTKAYLYDENGEEVAGNEDGGYDNNFLINYYFEAGKTYTLKVGFFSDSMSEDKILISFYETAEQVIG